MIRNAKQGSFKHLVALASDVRIVPSNHIPDVAKLFCSQFAPDPAKTFLGGMEQASRTSLTVLTSLRGLSLLSNINSKEALVVPVLVKSWSDIEKWFMFLNVIMRAPNTDLEFGEDTLSVHIAWFFNGILKCKDETARTFFRNHIPSLTARIWTESTQDNASTENWPSAMRILGFCLQAVGDTSPFWDTFLLEMQVSEAQFVNKLIQRGMGLLRQSPMNYNYLGGFLNSLTCFIGTSLWNPLVLDGGIDMVLRLFAALSKESHVTAGWSQSLGSCLELFHAILVTKRGYPFLVKLVKGGFVASFFRCSPNFDKLDTKKREICKTLVTERILVYFQLYPVVKCMATALEKITVSERDKLRQTFIEEHWVALETLLLERLVCKKIYDFTYKGSTKEMCHGISVRLNVSRRKLER